MNVLVMPSWFGDHRYPTLGSFFLDQAVALGKYGHSVHIIYPSPYSIKEMLKFRLGKKWIHKSCVSIRTKSYFTIPLARTFNVKLRLREYFNLFEQHISEFGLPDIIHAHSAALGPSGSAGIAANLIGKKYKIPVVITEHASAFHTGNFSEHEKELMLEAFESANSLIAVSQCLERDLRTFGVTRQISIIGNIVDTGKFKPIRLKRRPFYEFILVAYLRPIKRIDKVIMAFSQLSLTNAKLTIIGDGTCRSALEKLAAKYCPDKQIEFTGELDRKDVVKRLQNADCYINTSDYETFGVAVHEALSCGLSAISTNSGGPNEILKCLGYKIIENYSDQVLASMMEKQLKIDLSKKSMATKHKQYDMMCSRYSEESFTKQIETIFDNILARANSR
ncbi:glycosyltransferase [Alteromonas facilis]|uniref:glycosyltransferase n=1 Tax=Alteromonas facilis TaxID=2048004 RepID=UPI000C2827AE|nr:glycosyltransferase [Alteromonas facilis]